MLASRAQSVCFRSEGVELRALFHPAEAAQPAPALVFCHGAGEYKENYSEFCDHITRGGISCLAMDMRGHGESGGERYHVQMRDWVADIQAAVSYLQTRPEVDPDKIGAFGLSSGGTAVLEAAVLDSRLRVLVVLDPTVRNMLPIATTAALRTFHAMGQLNRWLGRGDLRVSLLRIGGKLKMASDPEVNRRLQADPRCLAAFSQFPFPGGAEAFFVDTIKRVPRVTVPTLILWGEEDRLDPPETGGLIHRTLTCEKEFKVIPGNGHAGHVDRNRQQVFELTLDWVSKHLSPVSSTRTTWPLVIEGEAAKALDQRKKWELLSPFITKHGVQALSYSTLQNGLEYYVDRQGYLAYITVRHPVFARTPRKIVFADPVCAVADRGELLRNFLNRNSNAAFGCISESCAEALREKGFKVNCIGYEVELPIQTYNTQGNWKELDMIKRARNEARREGITIREENIENVNSEELTALSKRWMSGKKVNDREIWIYARRPVLQQEEGVRKFVAYDRDGHVAGFAFYDPMYRDGRAFGYSATILRCDELRFGRLITAMHMAAMEVFKAEGAEVLSLNLSPFMKLEHGKFNDDAAARAFFKLSARYGNDIYNFQGLAFHKSKYRGIEKPLYFATKRLLATNDIYLAFLAADITRSYFETVGRLLRGMLIRNKTTAIPRAGQPAGQD